jgi:hypothetical protein
MLLESVAIGLNVANCETARDSAAKYRYSFETPLANVAFTIFCPNNAAIFLTSG